MGKWGLTFKAHSLLAPNKIRIPLVKCWGSERLLSLAAKVHFVWFCSFFLVEVFSKTSRRSARRWNSPSRLLMMPTLYLFLTGPHSELQPGECLCGAYIRVIMVPCLGAFAVAWTPIHYSNPGNYSDNNRGLQSTQVLALKPHRAFEWGSRFAVVETTDDEMSVSPGNDPHLASGRVPSGPGWLSPLQNRERSVDVVVQIGLHINSLSLQHSASFLAVTEDSWPNCCHG